MELERRVELPKGEFRTGLIKVVHGVHSWNNYLDWNYTTMRMRINEVSSRKDAEDK